MPDITLAELLNAGRAQLVAALGDDGTRHSEASILLASLTGYDRTQMLLHEKDVAGFDVSRRYAVLLQRRVAGEPVYRILGEREFHGLQFKLSPDTLEPRDDTEALIDLVLQTLPEKLNTLRFADLGTGTGAIALSLLNDLPNAKAVSTDISQGALEAAVGNASLNELEDRFETRLGSWCEPLDGVFDFIVSNPPYIASSIVDGLSREVLEHDPRLALDGGHDGLDAYRAILQDAVKYLSETGFLALEIGFDQATIVAELGKKLGWIHHKTQRDLSGRDRALLFYPSNG